MNQAVPDPNPPFDILAMIQHAIDAMALLNRSGLILDANAAFQALLDRMPESILRHSLDEVLGLSPAREVADALATLGTQKGVHVEVTAQQRDGNRLDLDITLIPATLFSGQNRNPTDVVVLLRDITPWKQAQAHQEALTAGLRTVLASASELMARPDLESTLRFAVEFVRERLSVERSAIFLVDENDRVHGTFGTNLRGQTTDEHRNGFQMWEASKVPPAWRTGRQPQDPYWSTFNDVLYDWDGQRAVPIGRGQSCLIPIYGTGGLIGVLSTDNAISGAPLDDIHQEVLSVFCSLVGKIIERKQFEDDIRRTLEKEYELGELKSRLIQSISHEFRTPIAIILTSAHVLRKYGDRLDTARTEQHWSSIKQQVTHMTELLEELLTIQKLDRTNFSFTPAPLDVAEFGAALSRRLTITASPAHQIAFTWQGERPIRLVDERLLSLIFNNLLTNAIMYSPEGGIVQFELWCEPEHIRFRVTDHGIGILPEDQEHIFQVFRRGKNVETIPGIGLGLSIVQRAVMIHEGTVTFESQAGVGTSFTVTLPAEPSPA